jgi:predicted secreted protein
MNSLLNKTREILMKKLFIATLLTLTSAAFAGDAAKLTHVGFSADGAQYAFMQSGVTDGSGQAYAKIRFLDTVKNSYSASAIEVFETEEEANNNSILTLPSDMEAKALKAAATTMKRLGISSSNKGEVVISRKITDLEAAKLKEATFSLYPIIAGLTSDTYKVKMTISKATPGAGVFCMMEGDAKKLKVEILDLQTKKTKILQDDKVLPASRGCVHSYSLEDVIVFQPDQSSTLAVKVVTLIRIGLPGFEGEDVRYMAVSGSLKIAK